MVHPPSGAYSTHQRHAVKTRRVDESPRAPASNAAARGAPAVSGLNAACPFRLAAAARTCGATCPHVRWQRCYGMSDLSIACAQEQANRDAMTRAAHLAELARAAADAADAERALRAAADAAAGEVGARA